MTTPLNHSAGSRKLYASVHSAIAQFGLVASGDHILVAVSGGTDSLLMLEALWRYRNNLRDDFRMTAVHIVAEGVDYSIDRNALTQFCTDRGIELLFRGFEFVKTEKSLKSPCFYCSWHRRKQLYALSRELGCNRLALGHHADDALETLMLNMCRHKSISSLPALLPMFSGRLSVIRPLILLYKQELTEIAETLQLQAMVTRCSFADDTNRHKAKSLIDEAERLFPGARARMFASLSSVHEKYLPCKLGESPIVSGLNEIHPGNGD
ncbi:MAG TPA: tRNA 2-thiocytidine biosynthesis TtcA family protein [Bacteroidales bacterium]|nr:tRNA 2-thiocytidine biosynthesis protein TtcA [Bacteroidales bacterium]HOE04606.1 tRNA 2-thiocytidine biosynthesis TtcA family protein [Bacteroidales bacterium]